jgi:hypothetical protein
MKHRVSSYEFSTIPRHAVTVQIVPIIRQFKAQNVSLRVTMIISVAPKWRIIGVS